MISRAMENSRGRGIKTLKQVRIENFDGYSDIEEDFEGYADNTSLETSPKWAKGPGDNSNGTTMKGVFYGGKGWFHDASNAGKVEKDYFFSKYSPGIGWSKVKMTINSTDATDTLFEVILANGVNVALFFQIANDKARIVQAPLNPRVLQINAVDIDPQGSHEWEFWLDEDNEDFRVFFDGVEAFTSTGFKDYYQSTGQIAAMRMDTGIANQAVDVYVDDVSVSWIPDVTSGSAWSANVGDNENGTTIMHNITEKIDRNTLLFHDFSNAGNIDIKFTPNLVKASGYVSFDVFPVTSTDANDIWSIYLYDGIAECVHVGIDPNNGKVYTWVLAVKTDTLMTVVLDSWNNIKIIFRPNETIIQVNKVNSGPWGVVANQVDGIDNIQFDTSVNGAEHDIYINNLSMS